MEKLSAEIPREEFVLEMISLYTLASPNECELLAKVPLSGRAETR